MLQFTKFCIFILLLLKSIVTNATTLPVEQAFSVTAAYSSESTITVNFNIAPTFFIYTDRLKFTTTPNGILDLNKVTWPYSLNIPDINDENKTDAVYSGKFNLKIPLLTPTKPNSLLLEVALQGCDGKSICYPLQKYTFDLSTNKNISPTNITNLSLPEQFTRFYHGDISWRELVLQLSLLQLMLIFFIAGILIALTPCMYPLYPIALSTIIGNRTFKKNNIFLLVIIYIHGIALIYVTIGVVAGLTGKFLTNAIQTPLFMITSSMIWLILGLSMFDLIEIKLPHQINSYLQHKSGGINGGRYLGVFTMGILSSMLLGPCVTPPLVAAIGFIVGLGNIFLGIICLYAISLGMGVPILALLLLGRTLLPKSGIWMEWVKYIMGTLIIAVSIFLVYPYTGLVNIWLNIGILCLVVALIFLLFLYYKTIHGIIHRFLPIVFLILGIILIYIGGRYEQKQITAKQTVGEFIVATQINELNTLIHNSTKPVLIDFYASWCSICKEMEYKTFSDATVKEILKNYTVIKFDITNNTKEQLDELKHYGLYGPPALIIVSPDNKITTKMIGFTSSNQLIEHLKRK